MTTSTAPPSEPAAVILAGDLLKWIIPKVGKFQRSEDSRKVFCAEPDFKSISCPPLLSV